LTHRAESAIGQMRRIGTAPVKMEHVTRIRKIDTDATPRIEGRFCVTCLRLSGGRRKSDDRGMMSG